MRIKASGRLLFHVAWALCVWAGLGLHSAAAADVTVRTSKDGAGTLSTLRFDGPIVSGDAAKLSLHLQRLKSLPAACAGCPYAIIELNSPGGLLAEGLKLGLLLRQYQVASIVRANDTCLSACALAFLGGARGHTTGGTSSDRRLELGGRLGFHGFYLDRAGAASLRGVDNGVLEGMDHGKLVSSLLIAYGAEMGIAQTFMSRILPLRQDQFLYVDTVEDVLSLDIAPVGLPVPGKVEPAHAVNACNHYTNWYRPLSNTTARVEALPPAAARATILEHLVGVGGDDNRIVRQIRQALAAKDEREINRLYVELREFGLPLLYVDQGTTFHTSGWEIVGAGFYVMGCVWNVSNTPNQFASSMLLLRTVGVSGPFVHPPLTSHLFLYDRQQRLSDLRRK